MNKKKSLKWLKGAQCNSTTTREVKISLPQAPWEKDERKEAKDEVQR